MREFLKILLVVITVLGLDSDIVSAKEKKQEKIYIPPQVKKVMAEGIESGQLQKDIKFEIQKYYFLPAQQQYFIIFVFTARNAELGYSLPAAETADRRKKAKNEQIEEPKTLKTEFNLFFWFFQKQDAQPVPFKEQYVPTRLELPREGYDPEQYSTYTVCTILPAGNYLFSMAITSLDLKKIGVVNFDFTLPAPSEFEGKPQISPLIFVENLEELEQAEIPPVVHQNYFNYTSLKVTPRMHNRFKTKEVPDLLYFIFGCKAKEDQRSFDIEVQYTVKKEDGTVVLEFAPLNFNIPFISHKLPLEKEGGANLESGKYVVEILIKDKVGGSENKQSFELIVE